MRTLKIPAIVFLAPLLICGGSSGDETSPYSDIERHVSRALVSSYQRRTEDLEREYLFFKGMDEFMKSQKQIPTGLSERVLDLMLNTVRDRDSLSKSAPRLGETPERMSLRTDDEVREANSLLLTDRYNRFVFIFNTFVRPLSLLTVGYFPALIDSGLATLLNVSRLTDLSVEEKKALDLYKQYLERYPDSDTAELLHRRVTELDEKRIRKSYEREMELAEENLAARKFWQAQQHFKNALALMPNSKAAADGLKQAREKEGEARSLRMQSLNPIRDKGPETMKYDDDEYSALLYAAAIADPERLVSESEKILSSSPRDPYAPHALYCIAAAHEMRGDHERAKATLKELIRKYPRTRIARHADSYLRDPEYNLARAFTESRKEYGQQTVKYVALGPDFVKSNVILGTSRIITQGLQAFQTLGTFNVMALVIRGVNAFTHNPVSDGEIIDAGIRYLRRHPGSPAAPDMHYALARLYERKQNMAKAVYHYEASGRVPQRQIEKLKEKAAKQYLDLAGATESADEKIICYETILDKYPSTRAAAEAIQQLAILETRAEPLFALDRSSIADEPVISTLSSLPLGPHMFDGDIGNGELAQRGIYSVRRGVITIVHEERDGEREESVKLDYPTYKKIMACAEEIAYRKKLSRQGGKHVAVKFPIELRGTVGDAGVYVYPRLKTKEYQEKDLYLYK